MTSQKSSKILKIFEHLRKILKIFQKKMLWPFCKELRNGSNFLKKTVILGTSTTHYDVTGESENIENFLTFKKNIKNIFGIIFVTILQRITK